MRIRIRTAPLFECACAFVFNVSLFGSK